MGAPTGVDSLRLEGLMSLQTSGKSAFFGYQAGLAEAETITTYLAPLRKIEWVVYAKRPFGGPKAVLALVKKVRFRD